MKQPLFVYKGKSYPVLAISFTESGELSHLCFEGQNGFTTVFHESSPKMEHIKDGVSHADLYKYLQQQK